MRARNGQLKCLWYLCCGGTNVADTPGDSTLFAGGRSLVGLTLNTWCWLLAWLQTQLSPRRTKIHDVVAADGTVVDDNVPSPEGYSVPLQQVSSARRGVCHANFTFLTSKRFLPSAPPSAALAFLPTAFFAGPLEVEGASVMSTSAMVVVLRRVVENK